jgi:two-component system, OmpR family, sensor histidine kinase KdpD
MSQDGRALTIAAMHDKAHESGQPGLWPWAGAVAAPGAATLICWVLDGGMSVAGLAMVYLLAVAATAVVLPRGPALLASLLAVSALNFFFVPPRYSLAVQDAEYLWTLAVLLGLSLALNMLIGTLRRRTSDAQRRSTQAEELHALSEALATQSGHEAMAAHAARWLHDATGRPCAVFLKEGQAIRSWAAPAGAAFDEQPARWALEHGRPLGRGCMDWPDLPLWCGPFTRRDAAGGVQVLLGNATRPSPETLQHWLALARQAGLSVERERASVAARSAQDSARSEAARNTLLASLSHDLRTPLAAIVGSASALRTQADAMPASQRERLLANLEDEARDMTLMADNVLQMARLSQPQWQLRTQWESAGDILGAAVARMRRRWEGAGIQLRVARDLPPLRAEAALLAQAIANLVDNAARHSGERPQIVVQAGKSREGVFIAVRDHGRGLPPGDPARLFEHWRQGAGRAGGGAGLGLAICRLVVEAHGGRIAATRCEPGAEFRIDLPAQPGGDAA